MFHRILFTVLFFIIINSCEENSLSNKILPPAPEPITTATESSFKSNFLAMIYSPSIIPTSL